jgi:hypothetical protein
MDGSTSPAEASTPPADGRLTADAGQTTPDGASACGQCVAQQCSATIAGCSSDPDCATYWSCVDACGLDPSGNVDPTCEAACPRGSSTSGTAAEAQLTQCRSNGAGATCTACGIDAGGQNPLLHEMCMPSTDPDACHQCEKSRCCDVYAACVGNPDCLPFAHCLNPCYNGIADDAGVHDAGPPDGDLACAYYCLQGHPNGLTDLAPLLACDAVDCSLPCNPGATAYHTCLITYCPDEYAYSLQTPDGFLLGECQGDCPEDDAGTASAACLMGCEDMYLSAKAAADALAVCGAAHCP